MTAMRRRRVILMRHGAVQYFRPGQGQPEAADRVPLTPEGLAQARSAGRAMAAAGVRIDRAVCSGLPRTVQTAEAVLQAWSDPPPLRHDPAWQEARGGRLRDLPEAEWAVAFTALQRGPLTEDTRFLGGERLGEVLDRILPAWEALRGEPDWDTALVVAHGVVNAVVLSAVVSGGQRLVLPGWQQDPAALNLIDLGTGPGDDVLRTVNLSATDPWHGGDRQTTMEALLAAFQAWRAGS